MRNTLILAAMLAAAPFAASAADGLSYNYVEAGWTRLSVDIGDGNEHGNGGYIRGSWQIAQPAYVFASFAQVEKTYHYDEGVRDKYTLSQPEIGIGFRQEWTERVDFIADIAYLRINAKVKLSGYDDYFDVVGIDGSYKEHVNAGRATVGVRGKPSPRTEAWIKAGYMDGSDFDKGEFVGNLGGQVNFNRTWGLVGEAQFIDDTTQLSLGVRASF
ncbi:MAG: hypothetical protein ABN502_10920 [Gammaproteobacteria bacterium]